jgi:hypothetical protein
MMGCKGGERELLTNNLRSRVIRVADQLEREGLGLLEWAKENQNLFWTQLYKAVIPKEVEAKVEGKMTVDVSPQIKELIDAVRRKSNSALGV